MMVQNIDVTSLSFQEQKNYISLNSVVCYFIPLPCIKPTHSRTRQIQITWDARSYNKKNNSLDLTWETQLRNLQTSNYVLLSMLQVTFIEKTKKFELQSPWIGPLHRKLILLNSLCPLKLPFSSTTLTSLPAKHRRILGLVARPDQRTHNWTPSSIFQPSGTYGWRQCRW